MTTDKRMNTRTLLAIAAFGLALAIAGCASAPAQKPAPAERSAAPAPPTAAPKPAAPTASALPAPASGMGTVVFFRDKKFAGGGVSFKVREGETELGKLSNGSFFISQVPAGAHAYVVHSEAKDVLNLEVEPGETYYVQGSISMGLMVGRPNLAPSDAGTFNGLKGKLKDSAKKT